MDFDPDATDNEEDEEGQEPSIQLSSIEINLLIYRVSYIRPLVSSQLTASI